MQQVGADKNLGSNTHVLIPCVHSVMLQPRFLINLISSSTWVLYILGLWQLRSDSFNCDRQLKQHQYVCFVEKAPTD